ncbi:MAG: HIT family protein [Bacteroidota bacterium]
MKRLFSPWRSKYIQSFKSEKPRKDASLFTRVLKEKKDRKNLIVVRRKYCFVMMNLYPYNSGHLMIIPYKKTSRLSDLSAAEYAEIMHTAADMMKILEKIMRPQGFNFGANIGRAAGAGIDDHIHFHIVPRWNGDTNFMPVLNDIKVVSEEMEATYNKIRAEIERSLPSRRKK